MESCCCNFHPTEKRFPRTVRESHIAHPHKGVQTWKPKLAVTKGFPQHYESPDGDSRVPQVCSPRRELTVIIQWQVNPYIHYCSLWCATAPDSLFFADNEASELSGTSMAIFLFSWYNYTCLHSAPGNFLLQNCCLSLSAFRSKSSPCGVIYNYVVVLTHFFNVYWQIPNNCYYLCSWRVYIIWMEAYSTHSVQLYLKLFQVGFLHTLLFAWISSFLRPVLSSGYF